MNQLKYRLKKLSNYDMKSAWLYQLYRCDKIVGNYWKPTVREKAETVTHYTFFSNMLLKIYSTY